MKPILVYAEDKPHERAGLAGYLHRHVLGDAGMLIAVENGALALDACDRAIRQAIPIVLLTDDKMPEITGSELVEMLGERRANDPEIVLKIMMYCTKAPSPKADGLADVVQKKTRPINDVVAALRSLFNQIRMAR